MISINLETPCIFVIVNNYEGAILKELLAGIEEEGIPYSVKKVEFNQDTVLRDLHVASIESRIGIAVGIIGNRIILQHNKLKEDKPLIDVMLTSQHREKARIVGANAARLYKVMPLKKLDEVRDDLEDSIREAVVSVLSHLKII